MIHVRAVVPPAVWPVLCDDLANHAAVVNLTHFPGASRNPDGDLVAFDAAAEAANDIIALLRSHDVHRTGSIVFDRINTAISDAAAIAEASAPGDPTEAVIWEEVEADVRQNSTISASYLVLMMLSVMIASVGILLDSAVLIVGSMVVGPDFGPLSGIVLGIHRRRPKRAAQATRTLVVGFAVAVAGAIVLTLITNATGNVPAAYRAGARPLTSFVAHPDGWSVVVAVLAGLAGTLALIESKSGPLLGVFISVTTVPAAANLGVAIALGEWSEARGAFEQLLVNLVVMVVAGIATMRVVQYLHRRMHRTRSGDHRAHSDR